MMADLDDGLSWYYFVIFSSYYLYLELMYSIILCTQVRRSDLLFLLRWRFIASIILVSIFIQFVFF